jgi:uncharacterized membrane protein
MSCSAFFFKYCIIILEGALLLVFGRKWKKSLRRGKHNVRTHGRTRCSRMSGPNNAPLDDNQRHLAAPGAFAGTIKNVRPHRQGRPE